MKMIKFVAATALASVAFLGMTLEPAAAQRTGVGYQWGSSNANLEFRELGQFFLLDSISNTSNAPEFVGLFEDAIFFPGSETLRDLTVTESVSTSGLIFSFGDLNLLVEGSSRIPNSTDNIDLDDAVLVDRRFEQRLNNNAFVNINDDVQGPPELPTEIEPVPEPATILGSLMAVGMGGALKRTASKKKAVSSVK
ncbi:MAG: PEP-CTERM sorting domain-containing protein [Cyanobacteria bacterium J06592_8]